MKGLTMQLFRSRKEAGRDPISHLWALPGMVTGRTRMSLGGGSCRMELCWGRVRCQGETLLAHNLPNEQCFMYDAHNAVKNSVGLVLFWWFMDSRVEKETSASRQCCFPNSPSVKYVSSIYHSSWVFVEADLMFHHFFHFLVYSFPWLHIACWNKHF